jgi:hypothetical protein
MGAILGAIDGSETAPVHARNAWDHPHRIRSEIECILPGILIGPGHNRREHRDIGDKEDDP